MRRLAVAAFILGLAGCGSQSAWRARAAFIPAPHGIPIGSRTFAVAGARVRVFVGPVELRQSGAWTPLVRARCTAYVGPASVTRARFRRQGGDVVVTFENGNACPRPVDELVPIAGGTPGGEWIPLAILSR